ncbi:PLP-dependent transferase [Aspergillus homomorphus CBS 101889]|uniref:Aspartate aminotransferase n=1 Tax=Aspergillus homomorphus (strain CBS 101889) TaxID=1450537 RepID=A0A395HM78_ASPHC|nr:PLP-dependent transferase [Aspergillus homomorphus CBS 101889]RAL07374.1 PLP-dependent transferase [Aspergillus homomorphus CBS 101889]
MARQYLNLPAAPPDPAFDLMAKYDADPHPNKVSLIAGAYRDENGWPWVLPSVKQVRHANSRHQSTIYSPTNTNPIPFPRPSPVSPTPRTTNTSPSQAHLPFSSTREPNDVIVLQACVYNPTGVALTHTRWAEVLELVRRKRLFVVLDSAYQGFATGDVDGDAWAVRYFVEELLLSTEGQHLGLCVAQSFSKDFGLYGERVGALHLAVPWGFGLESPRSQLVGLARAEYSNPPRFRAMNAETVFGDRELRAQWERDSRTVSDSFGKVRRALRERLVHNGTPGDWSHTERQIGMFSYTGLDSEQVAWLQEEYHSYLLPSGRVSLCGLNEANAG